MCKIEETTDSFKVGDFVYDSNHYSKPVYRIDKIVDNSYICKKVDDESVVLHFDTNNPYLRLWTLKNATNGDVIVDTLDNNIILFRKIGNNAFDDVVDCHCVLFNDDVFIVQYQNSFFGGIEGIFFPATKEQRERLFNKIKEYNYVWNSEEKRLSKAEKHKPKFHEGDWIMDKDGELLYQVQAVKDSEYWLTDTTNLPFAAENNWRLWQVGDIKNGDVLSYDTDEGQKWIIIYESKDKSHSMVHYHALFTGKDFIKYGICFVDIDKLQPASYKEEEVIFRLLEQNGLVWNDKEKKLIENNVSEDKTTYVDIDKVCDYLYKWNRKQVERFGSRATLGCYDFTINVREMLEEINS